MRKGAHVFFENGEPHRAHEEVVAGGRPLRRESDVFPQRAREQERILRQVADQARALTGWQLLDGPAIDEHAAGLQRIQAEDRPRERSLARAHRTRDANQCAGGDVEAQAVQRRRRGAGIPKGDVAQR